MRKYLIWSYCVWYKVYVHEHSGQTKKKECAPKSPIYKKLLQRLKSTTFKSKVQFASYTCSYKNLFIDISLNGAVSPLQTTVTGTGNTLITIQCIYTGLLIFCDVAISHNWPKIATNRIIHEKSQNLYRIAQFKKKRAKISLNVKFSDNLNVISRSFFLSKGVKNHLEAFVRWLSEQTGVLCFILHAGDLVLVFNIKRVIIGTE